VWFGYLRNDGGGRVFVMSVLATKGDILLPLLFDFLLLYDSFSGVLSFPEYIWGHSSRNSRLEGYFS